MKYNSEMEQWIWQNQGYDYYLSSRFMMLFYNCKLIYKDERKVEIVYGNYVILQMNIEARSINLLYCESDKYSRSQSLIQDKLNHEYNNYFNFYFGVFKITQYNMYALIQYMDRVKRRIDVGFENYSKLREENIKSESLGYLKIGINNAFSLQELRTLIDAYNNLYSLLHYACENGIEEMNQQNLKQVEYKHNMILESIHIGSEGFLVAVGEVLIVNIIEAFVKSVFESNREDAEQRRQELVQKAELEEFVSNKKNIMELIDMLDKYLTYREQGRRSGLQHYYEYEIDDIIKKIEQLQGTKHIDTIV